jgi:LacI family transcriptional regulator
LATIRDVAALAGVSAGTVSNVLNRPSYVTVEMRKRVQQAIEELGFVPTASARQYRAGRQRLLGMVVVDLGNPFFVDLALGAEMAAREAGAAFVVCNSGESEDRERHNLDMLVQQRFHGVMISPVDEANPRLGALLERGVPVVFVDRISPTNTYCSVSTDDVEGGRIAGRHLVTLGHERLAFAGDPQKWPQMADRLSGFTEVVGEDRVELLAAGNFRLETGRSVGRELARRGVSERPTAVFCANDLLALGLLQELTRAGLHVPDDIAILGYDDLTWAAAAAVPLSSVRQPRLQLGRAATRLLLAEIEEGESHQHERVVFQPDLVARASTGAST